MTSRSLFFKLLMEDLRRRVWAAALSLVVFFFSLPVALALMMEKTIDSRYLNIDGHIIHLSETQLSKAELAARMLEAKEHLVLEFSSFGNGFMVFLMVLGALVMGLSGFAYLHSKRKVDFYHSLPVRRELLYSVQFAGGLLMMGGTYLLNVLIMLAVSCSYGVPLETAAGAALWGWLANMLYFFLMYAVTVTAVMLTGNLIVSILGDGILFFFLPAVLFVLESYCNAFFQTHFSGSPGFHFTDAVRWSSPLAAYIYAIADGSGLGMVLALLAALAISLLGLELYRLRPSEAAGRAMAFGRTQAWIRLVIVAGSGLMGGLFFWAVQSRTFWALFGAVAGAVLSHCVVEIIYHFDFKKLFSHRLQLGLSVAAVVLAVLSFRYDWWGYDSWLPEKEQVKSAAAYLDLDSSWLENRQYSRREDGRLVMEYLPLEETVMERMELTQIEPLLDLAAQGRDEALKKRARRLEQEFSGEESEGRLRTGMTVTYTLKGGRRVSRTYPLLLDLENLEAYEDLFGQAEYKEGLYPILSRTGESVVQAEYEEAEQIQRLEPTAQGYDALLAAYQQDLLELSVEQRLEENPLGRVRFISAEEKEYAKREELSSWQTSQSWPVYPSFKRTLAVLADMGVRTGELLDASEIRSLSATVSGTEQLASQEAELCYDAGTQKRVTFEDQGEIGLILDAFVWNEARGMNGLCPSEPGIDLYLDLYMEPGDSQTLYGTLQENKLTPEIRELIGRAVQEAEDPKA